MIRLPLSTIPLGPSDLREFESRQLRRKETERIDKMRIDLDGFQMTSYQSSVSGGLSISSPMSSIERATQNYEKKEQPLFLSSSDAVKLTTLGKSSDTVSKAQTSYRKQMSHLEHIDDEPYPGHRRHRHRPVSNLMSPENATIEAQPRSVQSKDDFHYGGFIKNPSCSLPSSPTQSSSVSTQEDISAPVWKAQLTRSRVLPRSPLFYSQNIPVSPDSAPSARHISQDTSREAPPIIQGIMFSQPTKRRAFRHQTNSFSLGSSERVSGDPEQDRLFSNSASHSKTGPSEEPSFHEELRGSLLSTDLSISNQPSSEDEGEGDEQILAPVSGEDGLLTGDNGMDPFPPQLPLPLPLPFSNTSRSSSRAEVLPSSLLSNQDTATTSARVAQFPAASPTGYDLSGESVVSLKISEGLLDHEETSNSSHSERIAPMLSSDGSRSSIRTQPIPSNALHSPSSSPTPRQRRANHFTRFTDVQTPSRTYRVYNDRLPSTSQPQTPEHLPESRHRSRFHASYTAPVTRGRARSSLPSVGYSAQDSPARRQTVRRHIGRSDSPVGLSMGGFHGLYGGRENGDEEQDWANGIRFNNAEMRLWDLPSTHSGSGSFRETPEREPRRVDR